MASRGSGESGSVVARPDQPGEPGLPVMDFLFAEQSYGVAYGLVFLFILLGACAIGIPRFRKVDPLAKEKKKKRKR